MGNINILVESPADQTLTKYMELISERMTDSAIREHLQNFEDGNTS